jgi:hypothetical protein
MKQFSSSLRRRLFTVVLCSWLDRPARPRTQHDCHHDTKVKPEAATAVIQLLMMGGTTPKTCWAVNKRLDNELENCCIWFVIYLNSVKKVQFSLKSDKNKGYFIWRLIHISFIVSLSIFLECKMFQTKVVQKLETSVISNNVFYKIMLFMR